MLNHQLEDGLLFALKIIFAILSKFVILLSFQ